MFKQKMNQQARISPLFSAKNNIHIYSKALFFAFLSLLLICIFAINLPSATAAEDKNEAIPVTVEAVKAATFADVVKEVGKINAIDSAILNFNASEKISAIHFSNGDKVTKGQVIAELDNTKAKADLDKAKKCLSACQNQT
nr:biotin/lipoyl-binding protein [Shewanella putrefaciens]